MPAAISATRYTAVRVTPCLIHLLDSRHNNIVAAHVWQRTTVNGTGWQLGPLASTRTNSRKLHATPEDAIASMRYMTKAQAKAAIAATTPWTKEHAARTLLSETDKSVSDRVMCRLFEKHLQAAFDAGIAEAVRRTSPRNPHRQGFIE